MEKVKVLLITDDELVQEAMIRELDFMGSERGIEIVYCKSDNRNGRYEEPDVMIISPAKLTFEGVKALYEMRWGALCVRTVIVHAQFANFVFSAVYRPNTIEKIIDIDNLQLSNGYKIEMLDKNFKGDFDAVSIDIHERLAQVLLSLGISSSLLGFRYILTAVLYTMNDTSMINKLTSSLYPTVARRYGTTAQKVERAIRHAVTVAYNSGKLINLNKFWGAEICGKYDHPTSGELIAVISERMLIELRMPAANQMRFVPSTHTMAG